MIITGMEHFQDVCKKKLVEWYNNSCMIHEGPMKMISHQIGVDIFFKMWIGIFIKIQM